MKEHLKWLLFKIIYEELGLSEYEFQIKNLHIRPKNIVIKELQPISQYFFLKNDLSFDRLSLNEKRMLEQLYQEFIDSNQRDFAKLSQCLNNLKFKLLFPETNDKYCVWDSEGLNHVAPVDSIVLAFHFIEFDESYSDNALSEVYNILNQIQGLSAKVGYKVAVLEYNEKLLNAVNL